MGSTSPFNFVVYDTLHKEGWQEGEDEDRHSSQWSTIHQPYLQHRRYGNPVGTNERNGPSYGSQDCKWNRKEEGREGEREKRRERGLRG